LAAEVQVVALTAVVLQVAEDTLNKQEMLDAPQEALSQPLPRPHPFHTITVVLIMAVVTTLVSITMADIIITTVGIIIITDVGGDLLAVDITAVVVIMVAVATMAAVETAAVQ